MSRIFSVQDRQDAFDYVLSVAGECSRIVALVQVGSGAVGFRDERSDLDFVIALDSDGSMVTGSKRIGNKTYKFSSGGACLNP